MPNARRSTLCRARFRIRSGEVGSFVPPATLAFSTSTGGGRLVRAEKTMKIDTLAMVTRDRPASTLRSLASYVEAAAAGEVDRAVVVCDDTRTQAGRARSLALFREVAKDRSCVSAISA